ncbi:ABC transporter substrate-binding protein [Massilia niastensis]|uniref:ABC transporter substrate-binding protein n=1 Tax=Massilia niastensis TaxID=544911 RepID=UPI000399B1A9|nr:ABC transporter substrate-binding protein [Massilia niastensis]
MPDSRFDVQRRRAGLLGVALVALLAPFPVRAAEPLPDALRIAAVSRTGPSGKTLFSGSSALVAEQGWLAAELGKLGVKLQWVPVTTNSVAVQVNEAFANKSIDFAHYGDLPSIIANASGLRTQLVVPGGSMNNTYLVVPAHSTARSIKDLKGKKIALHRGRPWEFPFSRLLAANGMSQKDVRILNLNPQAGASALASGSADAFFTLSDAFLLEDKKVGKIIWSSKQAPQDWKMRAELWGDSAFLKKYPQLAQLVATAYVKAHQKVAGGNGREDYIQHEVAAGHARSLIEREMEGDTTKWNERWAPLFTPELRAHYAAGAAYAQQARLIGKPLDTSGLYAPQFVEQALVQLKLQNYWAGR